MLNLQPQRHDNCSTTSRQGLGNPLVIDTVAHTHMCVAFSASCTAMFAAKMPGVLDCQGLLRAASCIYMTCSCRPSVLLDTVLAAMGAATAMQQIGNAEHVRPWLPAMACKLSNSTYNCLQYFIPGRSVSIAALRVDTSHTCVACTGSHISHNHHGP